MKNNVFNYNSEEFKAKVNAFIQKMKERAAEREKENEENKKALKDALKKLKHSE